MSSAAPSDHDDQGADRRTRLLARLREDRDLARRALERKGPRRSSGPPALSFAQERLWFLDRLVPESPFYNVPAALRVTAAVDAGVLRATFREIVRRHEILRTAFSDVDGRPFALVLPEVEVPLHEVDLRHLPPAAREREAVRLAEEDARTPFDLGRVPLIRLGLIRLDEADYVLLMNIHHIAADGWSMGVLADEVRRIYGAFARGLPSPLAPLVIQYADFARWQRRRVESGGVDDQLAYWLGRLTNLPVLELPTDFPRRPAQGFEGETLLVTLPAELTAACKQFSRDHGVTLFVTLLSAFSALLRRYTGQDEIVIGEPIANRNRVELEPLIGFFVNSLVLRVDVSGDPTFAELLHRCRGVVLEADANQDIPFELLVERLRPERTLGRNPLFQVSLQFFSGTDARGATAAVSSDTIHVEKGTASLDLALDLIDSGDGLLVRAEYSTELFTRDTIQRLVAHLRNLLAAFVTDPGLRISQAPMLDSDEHVRLVGELAAGPPAEPPAAGVDELVLRRAAAAPHAVAIARGEDGWTYGALAAEARTLAGVLRARGVGPESIVALCLDRSPQLVASVLATWMAGGAYLPLDPALPPSRLAFVLEDAAPQVVVTSARRRDTIAQSAASVVCVDEEGGAEGESPSDAAPGGPGRLAYVIYTSGSTGAPKGVMVEHGALGAHLAWMQREFPLGSEDRVVLKYSPSFDVSLLEMIWPLLAGARIVIPAEGEATDPDRLARLVRDEGVTVLDVVPSMLAALLDTRAFASARSLRWLFCGGEALGPELLDRVRDRTGAAVCNMYGPTETTISATHWRASPRPAGAPVPIGRPVGNARAYVLDEAQNPVPLLVAGELHVGGSCVARGYLGRQELTRERFVPDPFSPDPFARMYRTGDRCRRRADGELEFLGRVDDQVKVRGHRVELGEVEAALAASPLVRSCAVALRSREGAADELVAYVIVNTSPPELWPSVGEHFVYDDLLYYAMTNDRVRTEAYRAAIARKAGGRTVVDLGSGADLVLARMCLDAGAERVYAIEMLESAVERGRRLIERLGVGNRLRLVQGDVREVELPERVDLSVSELIGTVGSSEGAIPLLNDARRFLRPDGHVVPLRCVTWVAAVRLPDELSDAPRLAEVPRFYAERVFERRGRRFDLRVCVKNLPHDALLSAPAVFEELDFSKPVPEEATTDVDLTLTRDARLDGLILWIDLSVDETERIDVLRSETSWLPLFAPVFSPGLDVRAGDVLTATCSRIVESDPTTPDYLVRGAVTRDGAVVAEFDVASPSADDRYGHNAFYRQLHAAHPARAAADDGQVEARRVDDWKHLYERLYAAPDRSGRNPAFDTIGWNSSYTGLPLSDAEMREQVDATVERIRGLGGRRLLEIGCGTGLLLFGLGEACERYTATDFAGAVVEVVRAECRQRGWSHVEALERSADDFSGWEPGAFDGVVLNSVVQYFPSVEYLARVLEGAARVVRPGGWIFVGDVRNRRLLELLDAGIELARAEDDAGAEVLRRRIRRRMAAEPELTLDPGFFDAWADATSGVGGVTVQLKRGRHANELTRFRFDAIVHVGAAGPAAGAHDDLPWDRLAARDDLAAAILERLERRPPALRLRGVPNARLAQERALVDALHARDTTLTAQDLRARSSAARGSGVEPELFWGAEAAGYVVEVDWGEGGGADGRFDVWWLGTAPDGRPWRAPPSSAQPRPWRAFADAGPGPALDDHRVAEELRAHLRTRLPEAMIPTRYVRLERFPMTTSGKVDRAALPPPDVPASGARVYVAPQGPIEERVAAIWREVLGVGRIGADTSFFDVGGHSLLATQVVSRLSAAFDVEVPLRLIFERPTIRGEAEAVVELQASPTERVPTGAR